VLGLHFSTDQVKKTSKLQNTQYQDLHIDSLVDGGLGTTGCDTIGRCRLLTTKTETTILQCYNATRLQRPPTMRDSMSTPTTIIFQLSCMHTAMQAYLVPGTWYLTKLEFVGMENVELVVGFGD
jgi:hypothetical protein